MTGPDSEDVLSEVERERMAEAFEGYVTAKPLPEDEENAECHNCGEPWDEDEWGERHINTPDTVGETWKFECPGCEHETFKVGT